MDDLQKQKLQGALVGFNTGLGVYFLARYVPLFWIGKNVGWDWFILHAAIGVVVGLIVAVIAYFVLGALQK